MILSKDSHDWQAAAIGALDAAGYFILTGVLSDDFLQRSRRALYDARERIVADVGERRLAAAGEVGTLRLLPAYDPHFFEYLAIPELLTVLDAALGSAAILHTQNGFVLPSYPASDQPVIFQNTFHRDFPRFLNGYRASVSALFAIDAFNEVNGATLLIPASHRAEQRPPEEDLRARAVCAVCPAGSMLVFDAALWHSAGQNHSGSDRLAINHQFTHSWIKQQIDYVRALGDEALGELPERSRQLLGWYTRVVTSLDEYYRPPDQRLYRAGQG